MRTRLLAALAVMVPATAHAQAPARIVGQVSDAASGAPLPRADVLVDGRRVVTGSDGRFLVPAVEPGRRRVIVRLVGYRPDTAEVSVPAGLDASLDVRLVPMPVVFDALAVEAAPAAAAATIDGAELVRRGADLGRALDGWEGIVVRRTGSGGPAAPQVRGGGPSEVLVLVDGVPLNDPFTGRADLARVASGDVARVRLLPGAQGARYGGRALTGVIAVDTRQRLQPAGATWAGSYGVLGARVGGSHGPATASLTVEQDADGFPYDIPEVRGGGEGERGNAGGTRWNGLARAGDRVEASARVSWASRGLPGLVTNPTPLADARDIAATVALRARGTWRGGIVAEWLSSRVADGAPVVGTPYTVETSGRSLAADAARAWAVRPLGWIGEATLAADLRGDRYTGDVVQAGGADFWRASVRAEATLRPSGRSAWTLGPAVRLDQWRGADGPVVSARVDASWQRGGTALTAAVGSAVAPPALGDLFFREGVGVRLNPGLQPERVPWEVEVGVRRTGSLGGRQGSASLRGFAGRVDGMVIWAPDFRFIWSPRNVDVARRGVEASLAGDLARALRADGSFTWAAVTYDRDGGTQVPYRPAVTAAAGLAWRPGAWGADARWRLVGTRYPNSAGTNPLPAYAVVDLGVERRFGRHLLARADVRDLLDRRAEFIAGFPTPGRTFIVTASLQGSR